MKLISLYTKSLESEMILKSLPLYVVLLAFVLLVFLDKSLIFYFIPLIIFVAICLSFRKEIRQTYLKFKKKWLLIFLAKHVHILSQMIKSERIADYTAFEKQISILRSDLLWMADRIKADDLDLSLDELCELEKDLEKVYKAMPKKIK